MPALCIKNISKSYGNITALNNVSFTVKTGEIIGLLGPNGAGKSTLISIVGGLLRPSAGTASIMGHDVITDYRQARRNIGIVPQEIAYDPFFSVRESLYLQLGFMGLPKKSHAAWIDHLINSLGLWDKRNSRVKNLSGGMKRRVLIAQALVHKPPVLVLDEPTAGVDVELRQTLWSFVRELNNDGHTILLTTHYLEETESLCDQIGIINHGELTHFHTTTDLMAHALDKNLILSLEVPLSKAQTNQINTHITTDWHTTSVDNKHDVIFKINNHTISAMAIFAHLLKLNITVTDVRTTQPSLEDVFLQLTQSKDV